MKRLVRHRDFRLLSAGHKSLFGDRGLFVALASVYLARAPDVARQRARARAGAPRGRAAAVASRP
jgi:hypothetical protein